MKLIVGLGNPGKKYDKTRHNIGFKIIDDYAKKYNVIIDKEKFNGLYNYISVNDEKVMLLKPQLYINLSGDVLYKYISYFNIDIDDVLIVCDDINMDFSKLRLKSHGSSGGHNGLKNIESQLATDKYKRLKIGVGFNDNIDIVNYVTGKFPKSELDELENVSSTCMDILDDFINDSSFVSMMNKYN